MGGGEHDWAIILGELGLLPRDHSIGGAVFLAGVVIYAVAVVAGWRVLAAEPATVRRPVERGVGGAR